MWDQFCKFDVDKTGTLDAQEFHHLFAEKKSKFLRHLFAIKEVEEDARLDFLEFLDLSAMFCLFDESDMIKFAFDTFDEDHNGSIDADEFKQLLELIKKDSADVPKAMQRALVDFDRDGDGRIGFDEFTEMNLRYPHLLWPAFRLQFRIQEATLGATDWRAHSQLLRRGQKLRWCCQCALCPVKKPPKKKFVPPPGARPRASGKWVIPGEKKKRRRRRRKRRAAAAAYAAEEKREGPLSDRKQLPPRSPINAISSPTGRSVGASKSNRSKRTPSRKAETPRRSSRKGARSQPRSRSAKSRASSKSKPSGKTAVRVKSKSEKARR